MANKGKIEQNIMDDIHHAISQISYGEVVITIHQNRVVQIEKKEKQRYGEKKATAHAVLCD